MPFVHVGPPERLVPVLPFRLNHYGHPKAQGLPPAMPTCLPQQAMLDFLDERLPDEESRSFSDHLENCPRCRQALDALCDDGELKQWRDRYPSASGGAGPAELAPLIAELERLPLGEPSPQSEEPSETALLDPPDADRIDELQLPRRIGQYELVRKLGQGGMGAVYEALHTRLKRRVALKLVAHHRMDDPQSVVRFHREMEAIGGLEHPHIVQALDAGDVEGTHYLSMQFVDGPDLQQVLAVLGRLDVPTACEVARQALAGLAHAHGYGIVHRDIKPSNLLLDRDGTVKVADLGLARLYGDDDSAALTASGYVVGTVDYMAPEQAFGGVELDARADLYSLGCVLYRALAGRVPFSGKDYDTKLKKLLAHANDAPPPVQNFREDVPAELERVIDRLLAKSPADRFAGAAEAAAELAPFTEGAQLDRLLTVERSAAVDQASLGTTTADTTVPDGPALPRAFRRATRGSRLRSAGLLALALLVAAGVWLAIARPWGAASQAGPSDVAVAKSDNNSPGEDSPGPTRDDERAEELFRESATRELAFSRLAPEKITRDFVYPLLNHEPVELHWPSNPLAGWSLDPGLRKLTVSSPNLGLLSLGEVPPCEGYHFAIDVFRNDWSGAGIGIFFGWHEVPAESGQAWRYQRLEMRPMYGARAKETPFQIQRSVMTLIKLPDGEWNIREGTRATSLIGQPERRPQRLEILVRGTRLTQARWAGKDLEELCTLEVNEEFDRPDYYGHFGTYNNASEATYRNATIELYD